MATKTHRKLALKKETLRTLTAGEMGKVLGGFASGPYCTQGEASGRCGSMTQDCIEERSGEIVVKNGGG